ncbi:MAG: arylsulfatase, partial [Planctomycetota bacterium]|nr:arylsulfatase [Planctomycetota bacterium]
ATPAIDSLAKDGALLDRFFVCQVCAPTRAEFLTGRYYPRTGVTGVSTGQGRLNADEVTIGDTFKAAGYATGAFGKWHNGTQPPYHPNDRGFDEYYGFTSGHWGLYFDPPLDHNGKDVRGKGFIIDDLTTHAIEFIEDNKDKPFFCYVPFNTPHSPMQVPGRFYKKFDGTDLKMLNRDPSLENIPMTRAALAMCENIDWNVGRILTKLDELKIADNTIVIYFSDNGPNSWRWNGGMKGKKGAIDEGGLRVPMLVRWPGHIPAGLRVSRIASGIDLLPTLADMAGAKLISTKPLDGVSIKPLLTGNEKDWPQRRIFSFAGPRRKSGPTVSIRTQRFRYDAKGQLFDIPTDPGQNIDVAKQHPEKVQQLAAAARRHGKVMAADFTKYRERPFTVGYGPSTKLPARDGVAHGNIQRSARAPNNSYFTAWTSPSDTITWDIEVGQTGDYEATVYYTCKAGDVGSTITLTMEAAGGTSAKVTEAHDPPHLDENLGRSKRGSESYVKIFKPLALGTIKLDKGRGVLTLGANDIVGAQVIDVHSVVLVRK